MRDSYVIIVEFDNTDPIAYGPYTYAESIPAVQKINALHGEDDKHVTNVIKTLLKEVS